VIIVIGAVISAIAIATGAMYLLLHGLPRKGADKKVDRAHRSGPAVRLDPVQPPVQVIGTNVSAIAIAAGAMYQLLHGLPRKGADKKVDRAHRSGPAVRLDPVQPPVRVIGTNVPSQQGLGRLPTIRQAPTKESRAARRHGQLPPDSLVTFAAERKAAAIDDVFAALDRELVGLVPVKKQVEEIGSLLLVDRVRQRFGLMAPRPNLHMCFTGAPGTGKTTVGLLMADLLHQLGYLEQGQLVHAMRDDLVGEYVGQTAPKTRRVLDRAMGGVLFIDEASALYQPDNSKDFGQEAIEILLQVMENERDKFIVILAGYKDRMDVFFQSNPGMRSRIAHHLDFADYDLEELIAIGRLMLERASYYLSEEAEAAFREFLVRRMHQPLFANARSVRNELERSRLRHAYRLAADRDRRWSRDDLMRLEAGDILPGYAALAVPVGEP
jgi:probable Rubsico expression protein CbbX